MNASMESVSLNQTMATLYFVQLPVSPSALSAFIVMYSLVMVLALLGNVTTLVVMGILQESRSVTDVYVIAIVVMDLLTAAVNIPLNLYLALAPVSILGGTIANVLCEFVRSYQEFTVQVNVLVMMVLVLDRYAVINGSKLSHYIHKKQRACLIIVAIIIISVGFLIPRCFLERNRKPPMTTPEISETFHLIKICVFLEPEVYHCYLYTIIFLIVCYILPMSLLTILYCRLAHKMWLYPPVADILENPLHYQRNVVPRKKSVRLLLWMFLVFALLWLPYIVLEFHRCLGLTRLSESLLLYVILNFTGNSKCAINPALYIVLNKSFREKLLNALFPNRVIKIKRKNVSTIYDKIKNKKQINCDGSDTKGKETVAGATCGPRVPGSNLGAINAM